MKNYSSKRAGKGKLAYRTPERFIYRKHQETIKTKAMKDKSRNRKDDH